MENENLKLEEDELVFLKSLESKLNVNEYSNLRNLIDKYIRTAKEKNSEAVKYQKKYKQADKNSTEYCNKYFKEETEKIKWQNYYKEVCDRYAKLEIELDLEKEKVKILQKNRKEFISDNIK